MSSWVMKSNWHGRRLCWITRPDGVQLRTICYTISFPRSFPGVASYSSLAHHDDTVDDTPIPEASTKVAHISADNLQDIVDFFLHTPELPGLIRRLLFLCRPHIIQCDMLISTDPEKECFVCTKSFQPQNLPKPGASLARKPKPCDQVVINERYGCWIYTNNSSSKILSQKLVVYKVTPDERQTIPSRPCNHLVDDTCFEQWMSDHSNADAGCYPYCQQHLTRPSLTIRLKVKNYYSNSLAFFPLDMMAAIVFPSHVYRPHFVGATPWRDTTRNNTYPTCPLRRMDTRYVYLLEVVVLT